MRMKGKQDIEHADADSVARLMAQMSEMRAKMDCLARDNEALSRELDVLARESQATISSLRSQLEGRQAEIERLLEQIRLANRRFTHQAADQQRAGARQRGDKAQDEGGRRVPLGGINDAPGRLGSHRRE